MGRLGVDDAIPREVRCCAELLFTMVTEMTIRNQSPEQGWTVCWVLLSPGAHPNT